MFLHKIAIVIVYQKYNKVTFGYGLKTLDDVHMITCKTCKSSKILPIFQITSTPEVWYHTVEVTNVMMIKRWNSKIVFW